MTSAQRPYLLITVTAVPLDRNRHPLPRQIAVFSGVGKILPPSDDEVTINWVGDSDGVNYTITGFPP